jgi:hypothetical protein
MLGGLIGVTDGGAIGQTCGGQIGGMSIELEHIALISPPIHLHTQLAFTFSIKINKSKK